MVVLVIQKAAVVLLLAVLLFNLSQRKHLAHGEAKRYSSLYLGGLLLGFYAATILFDKLHVPGAFLAVVFAVEGWLFYLFRRQILVVRVRCVECGARLPLERVLYWDSNKCELCDPIPESEREAAKIAATDSPLASGGVAVTGLRRTRTAEGAPVTAPAAIAVAGPLVPPIPRLVEEIDWERWTPVERGVLCFIEEGEQLLLIHKKRGLGAGKINAPGGRIDPGESPMEAAIRETEEEVGLKPTALRQVADISFQFVDGYSLLGYVFLSSSFSGSLRETEEALPFWCARAELPFDRMWEDDRYWLPEVLDGKYVVAHFIFDGDTMLSRRVGVR